MKPQELPERLAKIMSQNGPENCNRTMPEDLREAIGKFLTGCGIAFASVDKEIPLNVIITAALAQGFWLGHDYALEYGQLRGD